MIFVAAQKLFSIVCTQPKARNVFVIESDRIFVLTDQSDDLLSLLVNSTRSSFYRKSRYEPRTSYHGLFTLSRGTEVNSFTIQRSHHQRFQKEYKKMVSYLTTADEISFKLRSFHNILFIHRLQQNYVTFFFIIESGCESGCVFLQDIDWKNLDKQVNRALPNLKRQWDKLAERVRKDPEWRRFQWLSVKASKKPAVVTILRSLFGWLL